MFKQQRSRLPSPAMAVALVALFVALGGTGYAAGSLASGAGPSATQAKKKKKPAHADAAADTALVKKLAPKLSVANAKHAKTADTATNAAHASSADTAGNANTVGGETVKKFFFKGAPGTPEAVILHVDGLSITAGCSTTAPNPPIIHAYADTADTQMKVGEISSTGSHETSWSSGSTATKLDLTGGNALGAGTATYSKATGEVVSITYSFDNPATYGGYHGCTVVGQVIAG